MKLNIDQQLKERLVGMAVLLFLAIIVIPWILDGERPGGLDVNKDKSSQLNLPSPDGSKTHDINLQDGSVKVVSINPPERIEHSRVDPDITQQDPVKVSSEFINNSQTDTGLTVSTEIQVNPKNGSSNELKDKNRTLSPASKQPETSISLQEKVKTDPVSTWTVQLGSFGEKNNAERQVKSLADKGFPAFVSRYQNESGKVLFRVRVGTEKDRARADKLQARLAKSGFTGKVLTHP